MVFCASGYVGADLTALCKEAAAIAVTRIFRDLGHAEDEKERAEKTHDHEGGAASTSSMALPLPTLGSVAGRQGGQERLPFQITQSRCGVMTMVEV